MKKSIFVAAIIMASPMAFAAGADDLPTTSSPGAAASTSPLVNQACPAGVTGNASGSCTNQNQMGDTSVVNNNGETHSTSAQNGNSSAANPSNTTISPEIKPQVTQNTTGTISPTISPTTTSNGGTSNSQGNTTTADNRSSVGNTSTGASTSSSGGNSTGGNNLATGPSTASNGNMSGTVTGGNNTAQGGAGGDGGKGGAASSTGTNLGINGQQQGIDKSGNSAVGVGVTTGVSTGVGVDNKLDNKNSNALTGNNAQGQKSENNLANGSNSSSGSSSGGNTTSSGSNSGGNDTKQDAKLSADNSGNKTVTNVDAGNRSVYNSRSTVWAPVVHGAGAVSAAPSRAEVIVDPSCGPKVHILKTPVIAYRFGATGSTEKLDGFWDETIAPTARLYTIVEEDGVRYKIGHRYTETIEKLAVSSAGSFSIGGFTNGGAGAQGGAAGSGQMYQIFRRVTVRECIRSEEVITAPVPRLIQYIEVPVKPIKE